MSQSFKQAIAQQLLQCANPHKPINPQILTLASLVSMNPHYVDRFQAKEFKTFPSPESSQNPYIPEEFTVSLADIYSQLFGTEVKQSEQDLIPHLEIRLRNSLDKNLFKSVAFTPKRFKYFVEPREFAKRVLTQIFNENECYGFLATKPENLKPPIVVEFSSPNIAKPFHAGHLRSTFIGNCLSSFFRLQGTHSVWAVNYVGDWGTQYGLLALAYDLYGVPEELEKDPLKHLFDLYVRINKEASSPDFPDHHAKALEYFCKIEKGDDRLSKTWEIFKSLSITRYKQIYESLGTKFDEYLSESSIARSKYLDRVFNELQEKRLLKEEENGCLSVDLSSVNLGQPVLWKSNSSSMYLSRDIASAIERFERLSFEKMYYVVGNEQSLHFKQLIEILKRLGPFNEERKCVIIVDDMMKEAEEIMFESMQIKQSLLSAGQDLMSEEEMKSVSRKIGLSSLVFQDLQAKRMKGYRFDWSRIRETQGDTGVLLQYTIARIYGVERMTGAIANVNSDVSLLLENEPTPSKVFHLIYRLSLFPHMVERFEKELEPCVMTRYLLDLCQDYSKAQSRLRVKDAKADVAEARFLLLWCVRRVLQSGATILGLPIVEKM